MVIPPSETRYAKTRDGAHLAFQVIGEGAYDIVIAANNHSIDTVWDEPRLAGAVEDLSQVAQVIMFDRRGLGASDALPERSLPAIEDWMNDIVAVLDAARSQQATLVKTDAAAPALMAATTHPDRITSLVLVNAYARLSWAPDYDPGLTAEIQQAFFRELDSYSPEVGIDLLARPRANDPVYRSWYARALRSAGSPSRAAALLRQELDTDARRLLSLVQVPTVVLHSATNPFVSPAHGRYMAERIPGARFVELPGSGHSLSSVALESFVEEIVEHITGGGGRLRINRVLAAVLISDIVDSTPIAARIGDAAWRRLLDEHDALVARQLQRFGGRLVKTTGDGVVATFDGPARAVDCGAAIRDGVRRLDLHIRVGVHCGEIELRGDDVSGIAVHVAARVAAKANAGEILVSRTVVDLVAGSGINFDDRGEFDLKGVPGSWRLFAAASP